MAEHDDETQPQGRPLPRSTFAQRAEKLGAPHLEREAVLAVLEAVPACSRALLMLRDVSGRLAPREMAGRDRRGADPDLRDAAFEKVVERKKAVLFDDRAAAPVLSADEVRGVLVGFGRLSSEQLETLWSIAAALGAALRVTPRVEELCQQVVRQAKAVVSADDLEIWVPFGERWDLAAWTSPAGTHALAPQPLLARVFSRGATLWSDDATLDPAFHDVPEVGDRGIRAVAAFPALHDERVYAVLYCHSMSTPRAFSAPQRSALQKLADELGQKLA